MSVDSALVGFPCGAGNGVYLCGDFDVTMVEEGARVLKASVDENEWCHFDWCEPFAEAVESGAAPSCAHSCPVHEHVGPGGQR